MKGIPKENKRGRQYCRDSGQEAQRMETERRKSVPHSEGKERGERVGRTCLSFKPSNKTSSMIVSLGILPPLPSSSAISRSLGSHAIPPPPRKAEPACEWDWDWALLDELFVVPFRESWFEFESVGDVEEVDWLATLRRDSPPWELMVSNEIASLPALFFFSFFLFSRGFGSRTWPTRVCGRRAMPSPG